MTLAAQVTPTGIVVPSYADVLLGLQNLYWGIYGSDAVLTPDTQDGQFLSVLAQAITDNNQLAAAVYNSFNPAFAQGAGLSSLVKINGIRRDVATNSQVVVTVVGVAGTQINNGAVGDNSGLSQIWALPALVTIPPAGTIDVTATNVNPGAIPAGASTLTVILTPTFGWQTVTNGSNEASLGSPVESDAALRARQTKSTSLAALTPTEAIYAAVANVPGVSDLAVYNNDTGAPDGDGVPAHSIAVVVDGGDVLAVATAIFDKKGPGTGTYGTTSQVVIDQNGVPDTINFFELAFTHVYVSVTVTPLTGYSSAIGAAIVASIAALVNNLKIGQDVSFGDLIAAATLFGQPGYGTFNVNVSAFFSGTAPAPSGQTDIAIDFNKRAQTDTGSIVLTVS